MERESFSGKSLVQYTYIVRSKYYRVNQYKDIDTSLSLHKNNTTHDDETLNI